MTWSLRLPIGLPLQDLDGCTLDSEQKCLVVNGVPYKLIPDSSFSLSVLKPVEDEDGDVEDEDDKDSSEDDDEATLSSRKRKREKKKKKNKTKAKKLEAHPTDGYALVENNLDASAAMLKTTNIDTDSSSLLRKAYRHVPQISGLKRRWMPPGVSWKPTLVQLYSDDVGNPHHQPFENVIKEEEPSFDSTPAKDEKRHSRAATKKDKKSSSSATKSVSSSTTKKSSTKKAKKESKERKTSKRSSRSSSKNSST